MSRSQSHCVSCCALTLLLTLSPQMMSLKSNKNRAMSAEIDVLSHTLSWEKNYYIQYFGGHIIYKSGMPIMMMTNVQQLHSSILILGYQYLADVVCLTTHSKHTYVSWIRQCSIDYDCYLCTMLSDIESPILIHFRIKPIPSYVCPFTLAHTIVENCTCIQHSYQIDNGRIVQIGVARTPFTRVGFLTCMACSQSYTLWVRWGCVAVFSPEQWLRTLFTCSVTSQFDIQ